MQHISGTETKAFDLKKLPKTLRVAMDSSPLEGAGRVEGTINLLAHAGRKIVACIAELGGWTEERVCREAGCPLLVASSVKATLDLDWGDPDERATAIPTLNEQLTSLEQWLTRRLPDEMTRPPLDVHVATLHQIIDQDLGSTDRGGRAPPSSVAHRPSSRREALNASPFRPIHDGWLMRFPATASFSPCTRAPGRTSSARCAPVTVRPS